MSRPLFLEAEVARRLLEEYALEGDDRQIATESQTLLPEIIGRLVEADAADEAAIAQCQSRAQELRLRAERISHRIDRRREGIADALAHADVAKLDCGTATISVRSVSAGVLIVEPALLPAQYGKAVITTVLKPDKALIKEALQAGTEVPGATLTNARRSITVRRT